MVPRKLCAILSVAALLAAAPLAVADDPPPEWSEIGTYDPDDPAITNNAVQITNPKVKDGTTTYLVVQNGTTLIQSGQGATINISTNCYAVVD